MSERRREGHPRRALRALARAARNAFEGPSFALFTLTVLAGLGALTAGLLAVPAGEGTLAAFAEDFRRWCLPPPQAGWRGAAAMAATFAAPAALALVTLVVWWRPLRDLVKQRAGGRGRRLAVPVAAGLAATALLGLGLVPASSGRVDVALDLPAGLRTRQTLPAFDLVDQAGEPLRESTLRGRVVVLTSVYSRCALTCPMILAQAHRVVDGLDPELRRDLSVVAITLDPEHDTVEHLAEVALARGMERPTWHLATGAAPAVEATLDALGVARRRDERTGVIDHVNLFILVDREGFVAHRFTLGQGQERWMGQALRELLAEPSA